MVIDWSHKAIGLRADMLKQMRANRTKYIRMTNLERAHADEIIEAAKTAFKAYFADMLFKDYPVKKHLAESIGVEDANLSAISKTPRRMSARTIGLVGAYDHRYAEALPAYLRLEFYYFLPPAGKKPARKAQATSAAASDRLAQARAAIDELTRIVEGKK